MLLNFLTTFFLFFVLLPICCSVSTDALAEAASTTAQNAFSLFEKATKFGDKNGDGSVSGKNNIFQSFTSPSLNYVNGVLVVFAQADENGSGKKCDIVEGYFKLKDKNKLIDKFSEGIDKVEWKRRVVTKDGVDERCMGNPTTVVNDKDIYLFFKNSTTAQHTETEYWVIGGQAKDNNGITWNTSSENLTTKLQLSTSDQETIFSVDNGDIGIKVNKTFVAPLWYTKKKNQILISLITNSTEQVGEKWNLVLSKHSVEEKHPAIVEWNGKLIMMTSSTKGYRKIYESSNMGTEWKEAFWSLSAVWGNSKKRTERSTKDEYGGRNGFIKVDFGSEKPKIILVTQPVETKDPKHELHLWMTDYQRVFDVGAISAGVEKNTSSTLLFAENELFVAYETWAEEKGTINVKHLTDELTKIKEVLQKWKEQDKELSKSCFAHDLTITNQSSAANKISTVGLVGFLSGNYSSDKWGDEYWCVNATVKRGTNVSNGLQFNGPGAGAMWPVSEKGQNEPYHFANNEFTLVATVKIDGDTNNKKNSILGIGLGGSDAKNSIGLWCNNEKWSLIDKKSTIEETQSIEKTCVKDGIYHVALILNQNTLSVYIGNKKNGKLPEISIVLQQPLTITHFYFGADTTATSSQAAVESHVTVTNVLLYNRPFGESDINTLKEYIKPVEVIKTPDNNTNTTGNNDEQTSTHLPPTLPASPTGDEKKPSQSRTGDGGVGGGVRVFSLLLALLCVSAPLLHL